MVGVIQVRRRFRVRLQRVKSFAKMGHRILIARAEGELDLVIWQDVLPFMRFRNSVRNTINRAYSEDICRSDIKQSQVILESDPSGTLRRRGRRLQRDSDDI